MNLFDHQPRITQLDRKRLEPVLAAWNKLSPALKTMTEDDIKRCVLIEATSTRRTIIVERLLGRYNKQTRNRILHAIKNTGA